MPVLIGIVLMAVIMSVTTFSLGSSHEEASSASPGLVETVEVKPASDHSAPQEAPDGFSQAPGA